MKKINLGIVGATGLVGQTMLKVIEERGLEINNLYLFASSRSKGNVVYYKNKEYIIKELNELSFENKMDIVLFAVDSDLALKYIPLAIKKNMYVVDNSSAYRMDPSIPLIVPEVNVDVLNKDNHLIANPNCTTIQSVIPLHVIDQLFNVASVDYTSYQSVSGSGLEGIKDLEGGKDGKAPNFYPKAIYGNIIPQIDNFTDNGFTKEELKMVNETNKILNKEINVSATCVRVPVLYGHAVSMVVETVKTIDLNMLINKFKNTPNIQYYDNNTYPTPLDVEGLDNVHVARVRIDLNNKNKVHLLSVADNIRKGAATNAVQIVEYIKDVYL